MATRPVALVRNAAVRIDSTMKKSPFRAGEGSTIVACGTREGAQSIPADDERTFTLDSTEECRIERMIITSDQPLSELEIQVMSYNNDGLQNGKFPAGAFAHDVVDPLIFGHKVDANSTVKFVVKNHGANAALVQLGFSAVPTVDA